MNEQVSKAEMDRRWARAEEVNDVCPKCSSDMVYVNTLVSKLPLGKTTVNLSCTVCEHKWLVVI